MTPVILLSDGYLGNGAEPWRIPDPDALARLPRPLRDETPEPRRRVPPLPPRRDDARAPVGEAGHAGPRTPPRRAGEGPRDRRRVATTPRTTSDDEAARRRRSSASTQEIPPTEVDGDAEGDVLVVGWGSTRGRHRGGREGARARRAEGGPHPPPLAQPAPARPRRRCSAGSSTILVPELNNGQLVHVLRDRFLLPVGVPRQDPGPPLQGQRDRWPHPPDDRRLRLNHP